MGRPVLASNISGCKEIVEDGKTGFLFEKGSTDSIVNALNKFLNTDYEDLIKMGKSAREKVEKEFDRNIIVNKYLDIIKEIEG